MLTFAHGCLRCESPGRGEVGESIALQVCRLCGRAWAPAIEGDDAYPLIAWYIAWDNYPGEPGRWHLYESDVDARVSLMLCTTPNRSTLLDVLGNLVLLRICQTHRARRARHRTWQRRAVRRMTDSIGEGDGYDADEGLTHEELAGFLRRLAAHALQSRPVSDVDAWMYFQGRAFTLTQLADLVARGCVRASLHLPPEFFDRNELPPPPERLPPGATMPDG